MSNIRPRATFLLMLAMLLSIAACGGGGAGSSAGSGGSGLGPGNPEDVFDLPNILPDSFLLSSCTPFSNTPDTVHDLSVTFAAPDSEPYDFDGDGDDDSFIIRDDSEALGINISSLSGNAFPPSTVDFGFVPRFIAGLEYDTNGVVDPTINNAFAFDLLSDYWVAPFRRPIIQVPSGPGFHSFAGPGIFVFGAYFVDVNLRMHCVREAFRIINCPVAGYCT